SPCWGMRPTPCCPISPRVRPWRSRTRRCSHNGWRTPATIPPAPCAPTNGTGPSAPPPPQPPPPPTASSISLADRGRVCSRPPPPLGGGPAVRRFDLALWGPARLGLKSPPHAALCDHHRRKPAEASLARRAQPIMAALAGRRCGTRGRQARRHVARAQAAGGL